MRGNLFMLHLIDSLSIHVWIQHLPTHMCTPSVHCSNAKPKIADYAFTTVVPNLGVCDLDGNDLASGKSLVLVDIPGLLEGAHDGVGLGLSFLRHVQRCRLVPSLKCLLLPIPFLSYGGYRRQLCSDCKNLILPNKSNLIQFSIFE